MKILAILAALFLSIGYGYAQTYEKFVEKSFDFLDKNDLVSAEESLRAAMRLEPGNPNNYALLMNLGTIQRRQGSSLVRQALRQRINSGLKMLPSDTLMPLRMHLVPRNAESIEKLE